MTENATTLKKPSAAAATKGSTKSSSADPSSSNGNTKKSNNNNKNNKQNNNNKQRKSKPWSKRQISRQRKWNNRNKINKRNKNNNSNTNRPYTDLTTEELKLLTEYHLSQNIHPNGIISIGTMTSAQMHEFSRLISSWSKLTTTNNVNNINSHGILSPHRRQDKVLAAEMAEQCLRELIEEFTAGNANATKILTPDLYYLVIKAWIKVDRGYKDLNHATSLLDLMERMHDQSSSNSRSQNENDRHQQRFQSSSFKCYATVLDGWCKSRSMGAEVKAEEILSRMGKKKLLLGSSSCDVRHYNNVMNRIATSGKSNAGDEAERLLMELIAVYKLQQQQQQQQQQNDTDGGDTTATANTAMAVPSSSSSSSSLAPNRNSFNTVIKAYANAGGKNAATNAQRILSMMYNPSEKLGLTPDVMDATQIMPDKISYTSILMAWANDNNHRGGARGGRRRLHNNNGEGGGGYCDKDAGIKAEELLDRMMDMYESGKNREVKPDTVTYNAVLKVWGKCGHPNAGERSEALLNKMLQLYENGGDPNIIPDDVTFNSVIHNIANSNTVNSPERAMQLLERMEQYHESGLIESRPDIISYNSVLNAFAKSSACADGRESAQHAEEMLDNLERSYRSGVWNIRPDVYSYNIVISAWGNCGDANRAVALLDRMERMKGSGSNLKPDATTYNSVLHAWSQSSDRNAPVKALGLLEIMLRLHEGGDRSANPDVMSFSTVINAFSKSKFPRKARQTRDLLRRMKYLYEKGQRNMQPNVYVYAAVLNACAYTFGRSEEKEEALNIGIETYEELQSSPGIETNHVAYGSFIRVCRRLMTDDDSRMDDFITRAFRQCCSDGQLGEYVLRQLRAVPRLYVSLLQEYVIDDNEVSYEDLPSSWTCNVKDRKRRNFYK
ncbi:hypothetical protein ACHAXR_012674 [Thalassiosira sp. AJA248-18]